MNIKVINNLKFKVKKYSPEILTGIGIAGTIISTVLACKATIKATGLIEANKEYIDDVHKCLEDDNIEYNEEDKKKDLTIIYTKTAVEFVKLYSPAVVVGVASIASIISGQKILKERNLALAAAYTAVDKGFKKYRSNVVERFGEQVDKELRYNIKAKEVQKTITDKNGKEKTITETEYSIDGGPEGISEYAKFFDENNSSEHHKDAEYNLMFLRRQQDYANEKLKANGHLFLNEVYDMLGIPRTRAGQMVGWIYNKDVTKAVGDNYVDFGIYNLSGYEPSDERKKAFVNGNEKDILLDFNVDGVIYDKI